MSDFYRTRIGHTFFESTMQRIAAALESNAAVRQGGPEGGPVPNCDRSAPEGDEVTE